MVRLKAAFPASLAALGTLLSWLNPVPSIPEGHQGLCRTIEAAGGEYIVCDVPLDRYAVSLVAVDGAGAPLKTFERVRQFMKAPVRLIMNGGMYHEDRLPVGLTVQDGREIKGAETGRGSGNFSMKPNGVFFIENGRANVTETGRYLAEGHEPTIATQSGPMLVIDGQLHPRFFKSSDSRYVRNGVCAVEDGRVVRLVMSRRPVNFFTFASVFRDRLGCADALFLDGQVSSLYYPAASIDYRRDVLGPMLVVTDRAD